MYSEELTASRAQVLDGYTAVTKDSDDEAVEGTMPNRGAVSHSLAINGSYTIPQGYHNGSGKVSQSIPTQGAKTITPNGSTQTVASGRYLTGAITVPGFSMPAANLIKKGAKITIYGRSVTGTWEGYVASSTDLYSYGNNVGNFALNGHFTAESGMLTVQYNYDNEAIMCTQKQYNLAGYTKINITLKVRNASSKKISFGYSNSAGSQSTSNKIGYKTVSKSDELQTISVPFNNLNITKYIWVSFEGYITADIYRIWLS